LSKRAHEKLEKLLTPEAKVRLDAATEEYRTRMLRKAVEIAAHAERDKPNGRDIQQAVIHSQKRVLWHAIPAAILLAVGFYQAAVLLMPQIAVLPWPFQLALWMTPLAILVSVLLDFAIRRRA
jgi:hypothetical protein